MTRLLRALTTAACALALLAVPPAHASGSSYEGDCGFTSINQYDATGPDVFVGVVYANVILYGHDHDNVVNATVTCELSVNGVVRDTASGWGSGVVAFADTISYTATDVDVVGFCTVVDFTSDDTPTARDCMEATTTQEPPTMELVDWFSVLMDWVDGAVIAYVDPTVCEVLPLLAPGIPPHVTVDEQGDVYLGPDLFWDCPPYVGPTPNPPPPLTPPPLPGFEPFVPTGGGYNTGAVGFLQLVAPDTSDVASACAYVTDDTGVITVVGSTATAGAAAATIHCRLTDTATGAVLYDEAVRADAPVARLLGTIAANAGPVTVCTGGTGEWAERTVPVGPHCRIGEPLDES